MHRGPLHKSQIRIRTILQHETRRSWIHSLHEALDYGALLEGHNDCRTHEAGHDGGVEEVM